MERCLAARRILYVWLDGGTRGRGGRASETGTTGVGGGGDWTCSGRHSSSWRGRQGGRAEGGWTFGMAAAAAAVVVVVVVV